VGLDFPHRSALARIDEPLDLLIGLFANSPVAFSLWNRAGDCLLVNDAFRALYGAEPPPGYNLFEDPALKAQNALEPVYRALGGEAVRLPMIWYQHVGLDGTTGPRVAIDGTVFPLRGKDGEISHIAFGLRDVTAEQQLLAAREAARIDSERRERHFRALVENGHDLLVLRSATGVISWVSPSVTRVLGIDEEAFVGTEAALVHPDDAAALEAALTRCSSTPGAVVPVEVRMRHTGGTYRDLEGTYQNRLDDPAIAAIVGSFRDATDRKQLQFQLLQSQKLEAIGRLAGGIAHDFNNMLSAILGFAGIVRAELPSADRLCADVDQIVAAAERASSLTRQLLAFSRKQILEPKVLDLGRSVVSMEAMMRRLLGETVELHLALASPLGNVRADPAQIEQVVLNLVINARDALPETGGRILIETANVELDEEYARQHLDVAPGPHVLLAVTDNGAGIEDAVRERIFEPFFTTKTLGKGTGLGLATVFGIVRQSGGHIWLYSEPGQGSTFKIYFPRVYEEATRDPSRPQSQTRRVTEVILLVEDEAAVRAFVKRALQRQGYVVLEAENGGEALLIAEQHDGPIDLLITDVVMPRMSGRALADRLAQLRPTLKVIFMSGYTENTIVHQGVLDDGCEFLPKPVSLENLYTRVRQVLDA
jgi:PAS domain S-box-containing protein